MDLDTSTTTQDPLLHWPGGRAKWIHTRFWVAQDFNPLLQSAKRLIVLLSLSPTTLTTPSSHIPLTISANSAWSTGTDDCDSSDLIAADHRRPVRPAASIKARIYEVKSASYNHSFGNMTHLPLEIPSYAPSTGTSTGINQIQIDLSRQWVRLSSSSALTKQPRYT